MQFYISLLFVCLSLTASAQTHPGLILTKNGVEKMAAQKNPVLFDKVLSDSKRQMDLAIAEIMEVPIPKDMGGGYTHEKHKSNYRNMQNAGALYQITGEEKYAIYIKEMLLMYTAMYPSLPKHPTNRSYAVGKIFWQCLNDANWMVYTSQAYDAIYEYLTPIERKKIESEFLKPYADYISIGNPRYFNRVHNHRGVEMNRILILWEDDYFNNPVLIDYFSVYSDDNHSYDMPYQFAGQIMAQNFEYKTQLPIVMGDGHGYQHLYQEAIATAGEAIQMNWFKENKFYTLTAESTIGDEIILARIGANDPDFNLRRDALLIHRKKSVGNASFLSVIENHGTYSPVTEVPLNPYAKIASAKILEDNTNSLTLNIIAKDDSSWRLAVNKSSGEIKIEN